MNEFISRKLLDNGWLGLHGKEAAELKLTTAQMEMCRSLGVSPALFKASDDQLKVTEALVNGREPDKELLRSKPVDLFQAPKSSSSTDLTANQREMCRQLGITAEQFNQSKENLIMERLI